MKPTANPRRPVAVSLPEAKPPYSTLTPIHERMTFFKNNVDAEAMRKALPIIATLGPRIAVELTVGILIIDKALEEGYSISIYNGGDDAEIEKSRDRQAILDNLFQADDDQIVLYLDGKKFGSIQLVYGNSGWDVISDYSTKLEDFLKPITEYCDGLEHLS